MTRVVLIHWRHDEAAPRVDALRALGHDIELPDLAQGKDKDAWRALRERPPDVIIIDLTRLPSHGKATAMALRSQKATRAVPLVFAGGAPEKVTGVRAILPDATYAEWARIAPALRLAARARMKSPIVPVSTSGYSGTPLVKKLGLRAGSRLRLIGAPVGFQALLKELPKDVKIVTKGSGESEMTILFVRTIADLTRRLDGAIAGLVDGGRLWIAWRKQSASGGRGCSMHEVRRAGMDAGWVDFKVCAIDAEWSGLAFSRSKTRRRA